MPARRPLWMMARAALVLVAVALLNGAGITRAAEKTVSATWLGPTGAQFVAPTHRYGHAIMGDLPEWGRLCLILVGERICVTLPQDRVFEDIAPRLADLDHDAVPEIIVVESSVQAGAALTVYRLNGDTLQRIAAPSIGTRNRWLAPAGIADLDGDGQIEIAYIDRPHLAKRLRIWRYANGALTHVADAGQLTNHRIGDPFITGGLRACGNGPEIVTVSADWRRIKASRLAAETITTRDLGPFDGPATMQAALNCTTP